MPKKAKELGALAVSRLKSPGLHAVGTVAGLHLQIAATGARSWILRVVVAGKRRDIGLGGFPDVTLALAHQKARDARERIAQGVDPVEARREAGRALHAAQAKAMTFEKATLAYIEAKAPEWKNAKHSQQWLNTLTTYAYPVFGSMDVGEIEKAHVLAVLQPIWTTKTETATRLRSRIELVIAWADKSVDRERLNPARWRGHLQTLLPKPSKVASVEHHAALPASEVGRFMKHLRNAEGMGARALEFAILTAARSGEVREAVWSEIDLEGATWTVPSERMKAGKEHRVPLSKAALALLRGLPSSNSPLIFPSVREKVLSDMTLSAVMRRMQVNAVPHGFRSTFRDWASERTNYPREAAEMALAHAIGDKVEAAYRRGDLFDTRRRMMEDWAKFCTTVPTVGVTVPPISASPPTRSTGQSKAGAKPVSAAKRNT